MNRATRLLLMGWTLLLIALVLPVIIIDLPNTDYARLLFLGPESTGKEMSIFQRMPQSMAGRLS